MKKILVALLFIAIAVASFAGNEESKNETSIPVEAVAATTELSGLITDKNSNEILVGVEVKLEGTDQKTYTDFDGKFSFKNLNPGDYKLITNYISYQKTVVENVKVSNKNNEVAIKLEASI